MKTLITLLLVAMLSACGRGVPIHAIKVADEACSDFGGVNTVKDFQGRFEDYGYYVRATCYNNVTVSVDYKTDEKYQPILNFKSKDVLK